MLGQGQCPHLAWIVHASMFVSLGGMGAVLALCTGKGRGALQKLALSSVLWAPSLAMALRCHFTGATSELSLYIYWLAVVTLSGLPWLVMATNSVFRRALDSGSKDALAGAAYLSLAFNTCVPPLSVALRLYCTGRPLLAPDATWHSPRALRTAALPTNHKDLAANLHNNDPGLLARVRISEALQDVPGAFITSGIGYLRP